MKLGWILLGVGVGLVGGKFAMSVPAVRGALNSAQTAIETLIDPSSDVVDGDVVVVRRDHRTPTTTTAPVVGYPDTFVIA